MPPPPSSTVTAIPPSSPTVTSPPPSSIAEIPSAIATPEPPSIPVEELLAQALVLTRQRKPQEALEKVEMVLKIEPNNVDAWRTKVALLRSLGRDDEAIAAFAKVLELRPDERNPELPKVREPSFKRNNKQKD